VPISWREVHSDRGRDEEGKIRQGVKGIDRAEVTSINPAYDTELVITGLVTTG